MADPYLGPLPLLWPPDAPVRVATLAWARYHRVRLNGCRCASALSCCSWLAGELAGCRDLVLERQSKGPDKSLPITQCQPGLVRFAHWLAPTSNPVSSGKASKQTSTSSQESSKQKPAYLD